MGRGRVEAAATAKEKSLSTNNACIKQILHKNKTFMNRYSGEEKDKTNRKKNTRDQKCLTIDWHEK